MILDRTFIAIGYDPGDPVQSLIAKRLAVSHRDNTKQSDWDIVRSYFDATPGLQDCVLLSVVEIDNAAEANVWLEGRECKGI